MDEPATLHAGIELDAICLPALGREAVGGETIATQSDASDHSLFVNSIFKKMVAQDSFLSFSRQISNVNKILTMKYSSANDIADVILKDMALTSKVLKLVNSSFYRHFSTKGISTISEAMIILGTDEIRLAAASLKIYEMMSGLANAQILRDKALKGFQRSIMARQIALEGGYKDSDALQISAMIYDLGEYLVALFAPDKYIRIEVAMDEGQLSRLEASKSILGLSYSDLGRLVALKLHLPETVVNAMRPVTNFDVKGEGIGEGNRHRYACAFTMEMCDIPMENDQELSLEKVRSIAVRYKGILNINMSKALELVKTSRDKMVKHAALLNIDPDKSRRAERSSGVKNMNSLNAGLKQIKENLDGQLSIHEIFTNIVKILFTSFYFTQACISIKRKETQSMDARFAKGETSPEFLKGFSFKLENSLDVFNRAVLKKSDIIVRDIHKEKHKKKIPSWYMDRFGKKDRLSGFAVFPVFVDQKIISMIYVDWDANVHTMNQKTIDYIRVFRELVVKTFTLHGR
ncbi:MAG: HDOD domain-containing protein [Proteobacteria bacterium]|nr:HDOD domain-containing protein [Desulfobacula sp.]MBU3954557.1 HDOD domain-containing protein [Pseudomonadota bacterium]MBU4133025.1 HDOD domain-containing protein [Pseudomonadota bacterium]